mgnify:CR=1 FL=1
MNPNIEKAFHDYEALIAKENKPAAFYNGIYTRYENPVLTRDHIPPFWKFDLNEETNPLGLERLGVNAVMNSGAIKFNGSGGGEAQTGEGGDLIFAKKFKNFELEMEWKVSKGGNSGIFYLAQEVTTQKDGKTKYEPIYISCPEYQVLDNANHPDAKLGVDGNRQSASLYDMIPAKPQNAKPFGEWNTAKIMVYNGTVVHYQNGEQVLEYHLWTPQWKEMLDKSKFSKEKWPEAYDLLINCGGENHEGYIGLQDHGDNVWFRNIRVKEL